ncbi:chemoreceptor glutamine deamidase CheD [Halosimplex carlsbadense 2-9-1]|uniref:Probable chemoreceptor glutamine deamidase CheD n=1 Tax=Halosimplex carlsbadense 2-9-1 TaxID=797114 RepID=M0CR71_9EURY|nr:chemotaxis protein CheD [Halosimplex carlsbadense]ELZ25760.1 chemoreceptor glutamine deamidase CheD [Halosimplex carlsbadense 2-9-1]
MKVYDGTTAESEPATQPERVKVGIAESKVADEDALLTTSGLGSCLGVAVYDRSTAVAGLVHVMLPSIDEMEGDNDAKFADSGIRALVADMERRGADRERMEAKIAGGSDMLDFSENGSGIGVRNVEMGRRTLAEFDIPIVGEDVGGDHGRSLRLKATSGELVVKSANRDPLTL